MKDDIIPLQEPIVLKNGETVSEIKVRKGQYVSRSDPSFEIHRIRVANPFVTGLHPD